MQAKNAKTKAIPDGTFRFATAAAIPNQTRIRRNVAWIRIGIPSMLPIWKAQRVPAGAAGPWIFELSPVPLIV